MTGTQRAIFAVGVVFCAINALTSDGDARLAWLAALCFALSGATSA